MINKQIKVNYNPEWKLVKKEEIFKPTSLINFFEILSQRHKKIQPITSMMLFGTTGVGKTYMSQYLATLLETDIIEVTFTFPFDEEDILFEDLNKKIKLKNIFEILNTFYEKYNNTIMIIKNLNKNEDTDLINFIYTYSKQKKDTKNNIIIITINDDIDLSYYRTTYPDIDFFIDIPLFFNIDVLEFFISPFKYKLTSAEFWTLCDILSTYPMQKIIKFFKEVTTYASINKIECIKTDHFDIFLHRI